MCETIFRGSVQNDGDKDSASMVDFQDQKVTGPIRRGFFASKPSFNNSLMFLMDSPGMMAPSNIHLELYLKMATVGLIK